MDIAKEKLLIKRAKEQDSEAIEKIYREFYPRIFVYIYKKTNDVYLAEDITQQAFTNALGSISSYRWIGKSFGAWLYRIAYNLLMSFYRQAAKYSEVSIEDIGELVHDENTAETYFLQKEEITVINDALKHLNDTQRTVLKLRFVCNLSVADTAFLLGRSISWVKVVQHRSLHKLRFHITIA